MRGNEGNGGNGGTVAFEKAPQNFYEKGWMGGVCASPIAHQYGSVLSIRRSFASGCGSIRLLRGESAGYSFGDGGDGGNGRF